MTDIYGSNVNILKVKTTRRIEQHVWEDAIMDVPQYILDRYSANVTLCADVMHVNGMPFFVVISRHIKHIAAIACKSMNKGTMLASIDTIVSAYAQ